MPIYCLLPRAAGVLLLPSRIPTPNIDGDGDGDGDGDSSDQRAHAAGPGQSALEMETRKK